MTAGAEYLRDLRHGLPPARESSRPGPKESLIGGDGGRLRHVLVVDDEPAILEILTEVLADEGCCVTGYSAPPPVDEIARLAPEAIILDLVFGGRNTGLGFLAMLRADRQTAATPVIVCTALTDPQIASALSQLRPEVRVITKPFDIDTVSAVVRDALGSSAFSQLN